MIGFGVLVRKELLEQWRTMRLGIVAIVFLAFGILSPVLAKYTPELIGALMPPGQATIEIPTPTTLDAIAQFTKNVGGNLMLAAILLAMGMIASERERGTAAFLMTKRASRGAFVAAKLAALAVVLGLAMALSGAAAWLYSAWLFPAPDVLGFAAMVALVWLSQLVLAAITLAGSAFAGSAVAAGGIGLAALLAITIASAFPTIGQYTPIGLQGIGATLASGATPTELAGPVLVNVALVILAGLVAWLVFRRKEL